MKRVLITGATGFIGRHCLPLLLARDYEVHALSSQPSPEAEHSTAATWHQLDLLNQTDRIDTLIDDVQPTHLLHLAWNVVPGQSFTTPENLDWLQSSLQLAKAFAKNGGKRLFIAGTGFEYDSSYGFFNEAQTPIVPKSLYAASKHALHTTLTPWATQNEIDLIWGRVFFAYGPYENPKRLVSSVILSLLRGEPAKCSHGNQVRDFLHIRDVAEGCVGLLDSQATGAYNIASGKPVTLRELVTAVAQKMDRMDLLQLGALPPRADEPQFMVADIARLQSVLPHWTPTGLDHGLDETIAWWTSREASRLATPVE